MRVLWGVLVLLTLSTTAAHAHGFLGGLDAAGVQVAQTSVVSSPGAEEAPSLHRSASGEAQFWPWWMGAVALGGLTLGFWFALQAPLGVSGSWDKVVGWRKEIARHRKEKELAEGSADDVLKALMAETLAQFGEQAVGQVKADSTPAPAKARATKQRVPVTAHLTFLLMIGVGGFVSSITDGSFELASHLGTVHSQFFGEGWSLWWTLFCGGFLVGFGTRLGGGCTSGHGLSGLACLQPGSIVGTMSFFGMAIVVSFVIEALLK